MRFPRNFLYLTALMIVLPSGLAFSQADQHPETVIANGKPAERRQTLIDLGMSRDIAEEYMNLSSSMAPEIGWFPIRGGNQPTVVLFLPCHAGSDAAYLYLLSRRAGKWSSIDWTSADCHYKGAVSIEFAPVFSQSADALLLHHSCDSHGTGYAEHHMLIFDLRKGRFEKRFERQEDLFVAGWGVPGFEQHSLFQVVPSAGAPSQIEETQDKRMIDPQTNQVSSAARRVLRRTFTWSQVEHRFIASPFHQIDESPEPTMDK